MKKNLMYALIAVTMLTGCAKSDIVDSEINKKGNLIGFSTYKNISRGNPVDDNNEFLTNQYSFGVTAFISTSASPYMGTPTEGINIVSDGTKWGYKKNSDQAYWPTNEEKLDFYAYAPNANTAITNKKFDKTDGLSFTYTVPAEEADQIDLMYALALQQTKPTDKNTVTLPFKHTLTQVHFKIGTSATNLKVEVAVNGIQIHNLKNTGTFSTKTTTWTLTGESTANYTVTSTKITEAGYYSDSKNTYTTIGDPDKALMLLPQEFEAGSKDGNNGAYLTISCKIYQVLADETKIYLHGKQNEYADVVVGISSKLNGAEIWQSNKKVTYNLLIGAGAGVLEPIEFNTEVETWQDAAGGVVEAK